MKYARFDIKSSFGMETLAYGPSAKTRTALLRPLKERRAIKALRRVMRDESEQPTMTVPAQKHLLLAMCTESQMLMK